MSYIYQLSLQCFNCFLLESPAPHCVGQHVAAIWSCPRPSPSVFSPAGLWLRAAAPPQPSLGGLPTARGLAGRGTLTPARECRPQTRVRGSPATDTPATETPILVGTETWDSRDGGGPIGCPERVGPDGAGRERRGGARARGPLKGRGYVGGASVPGLPWGRGQRVLPGRCCLRHDPGKPNQPVSKGCQSQGLEGQRAGGRKRGGC